MAWCVNGDTVVIAVPQLPKLRNASFRQNQNWQKEVQDIIDALRINPVDYINENVLDLVAMIVIIVVYLLLIIHHPPL